VASGPEASHVFSATAATPRRSYPFHVNGVGFVRVAAVGAWPPVPPSSGLSQFGRSVRALNIDSLCANSPQAKGRVERANGTLQDRLVKELRLHGLSTPVAAEPFLPGFMADYNRRFAIPARVPHDAHRPLLPSEDLTQIFMLQETRRITAQLTVNYKRGLYILEDTVDNRRLRRTAALIREAADGTVTIHGNGRVLPYRLHPRDQACSRPASSSSTSISTAPSRGSRRSSARGTPRASPITRSRSGRSGGFVPPRHPRDPIPPTFPTRERAPAAVLSQGE
jgi:hypothetical protein